MYLSSKYENKRNEGEEEETTEGAGKKKPKTNDKGRKENKYININK